MDGKSSRDALDSGQRRRAQGLGMSTRGGVALATLVVAGLVDEACRLGLIEWSRFGATVRRLSICDGSLLRSFVPGFRGISSRGPVLHGPRTASLTRRISITCRKASNNGRYRKGSHHVRHHYPDRPCRHDPAALGH